jgi:serine-type D-Ala-D-Ala carboxypeptidase (penicillin-binding protein 5/6)
MGQREGEVCATDRKWASLLKVPWVDSVHPLGAMNPKTLLPALLFLPTAAGAVGAQPAPPTALSAIAIDASSGKVLWSKDPDTQRFPASTTKIMTGLLLAERMNPNDVIVAPWDVALVKEASMHLRPKERVTAKDMLAALMLRSANDGCYAVAVQLAGSVEKFADMMNERARQIGCTGTHFHNPNGLNDPEHYTTARDLALIGREAMKNPLFASVVKSYKIRIERSINKKDTWMVNHNKLLPKDATVDGIKTGWTNPAGRCFVGSTTREGWRAITVVMKATDWQKDTKALNDWIYTRYGRRDKFEAGQVVGEVPILGGNLASVPAAAERSVYNLVVRGSAPSASHWEVVPQAGLTAPVAHGQQVGELVLTDPDGFEQRVPLLAQADVEATPMARVAHTAKGGSGMWIGGSLLLGAMAMRSRGRRRGIRAI